eukprot:2541480-Heterocapsa_arctica.AAC.1
MIEVQNEKSDDRSNDDYTGIMVNKQARKLAEEKQAEIMQTKEGNTSRHIERRANFTYPMPRSSSTLRTRKSRLIIASSMAK